MKILVHGSTGRMGKILCELLSAGYNGLELAARVSPEEIAEMYMTKGIAELNEIAKQYAVAKNEIRIIFAFS